MRGELKRLQHQLGTTTVYVTHDQAEAMTLAHRVAVMKKGKLQQFDTPMNVYDFPANRFVAEFVGSPSMNLIEGSIDGSNAFVRKEFSVALPSTQLNKLNTKEVTLGLRPEHLTVSSAPSAGAMPAGVYVVEQMGNETLVVIEIGDLKLMARAPADFRVAPEGRVWVTIDAAKAHLFDRATGERARET
jgi:multiple sugar transport system ATP-binding protein